MSIQSGKVPGKAKEFLFHPLLISCDHGFVKSSSKPTIHAEKYEYQAEVQICIEFTLNLSFNRVLLEKTSSQAPSYARWLQPETKNHLLAH